MNKRTKIISVIVASLLGLMIIGYAYRSKIVPLFFPASDSSITRSNISSEGVDPLTADLQTPWSIVTLPSGDTLFTERRGFIRGIGDVDLEIEVDGVVENSEGGLLGIALHPEFDLNSFVYLYFTNHTDELLQNSVVRYEFDGRRMMSGQIIIGGIPAANIHNGGAIAFGPDGMLYISTGDAAQPDLAQDTSSLAGKILRITDEGAIPGDNPFNNAVYSYGHRNPQGITWTDSGDMWSTEHGPRANDELNRIEMGENYGWPEIEGGESRDGMSRPALRSGDSETWAPANIVYHGGSLFFTGLRGQSLYQVSVEDGRTSNLQRHFTEELGRLRALMVSDGNLLIGTSNRDGRGIPADSDDRIFSFDLSKFD